MTSEIKLKPGYKMTELGVIPEDWEVKELGEVLKYEQPGPYIVKSVEYKNEYKIPVLTANKSFILGYINEDFGIYKNIPVIIFDDFTTLNKYVDFDFKVKSSAIKILSLKNKNDNLKFIYEKLKLIDFNIGDHKRYYIGEYQYKKISLPSLQEQKAIAQVISDTDELINSLDELIDKKEKIKTGTMQELLTGKKRLPGFTGEWEEKKLGEIVTFRNGVAHEKSISSDGKYIVVNSKFISSNGLVKKYSNQNYGPVFMDEILMVMSDVPNGKAIAKCFIVDEDNKYTLNQRICSLKIDLNNFSKFIYFLINRNKFYLSFDDGVKQTNLKKEDVLNCNLLLPPTLQEQKAISQILSDMDEEIENLKSKKEKYEQIKQAMMQELLTGKTRLV